MAQSIHRSIPFQVVSPDVFMTNKNGYKYMRMGLEIARALFLVEHEVDCTRIFKSPILKVESYI